ncbi:hypothetical protein K439DRAFT_759769 [Ramaria rubella]|nr:hypothetical protein K439DRAFT_759769 [Ramaria rubella]
MPPSKTILFARSDPTASPAPQHTDTSFFTFLIALLILLFASGALVLRAILVRRRFRRRVQEAIAAGIILPGSQAIPEHKPELYEVCVRAANNDSDWKLLMPVCATEVNAAKCASKRSPKTRLYHSDATVTRLISATCGQTSHRTGGCAYCHAYRRALYPFCCRTRCPANKQTTGFLH